MTVTRGCYTAGQPTLVILTKWRLLPLQQQVSSLPDTTCEQYSSLCVLTSTLILVDTIWDVDVLLRLVCCMMVMASLRLDLVVACSHPAAANSALLQPTLLCFGFVHS